MDARKIDIVFKCSLVFVIVFIVGLLYADTKIQANTIQAVNMDQYYAKLLQVKSINEDSGSGKGRVIFINNKNFPVEYSFITDIEDIAEGNFYSCIMDSNDTVYIMDDIVVSISRYERPDLW